MANMTRWDPFREMLSMRRAMDRIFDQALTSDGEQWEQSYRWELPVDVVEKEDEYLLKASIPGVNPDDLEITYDKGVLTIRAETRAEEEKEERYLVRERRYGSFVRSLALPVSLNANAIEASYENGILALRLPKTEEVKPKRIAVRGGQPVIEAESNGSK